MATTTFTPPMLRGAGTRGIPEIPAGSSFTNTYSLSFDGVDDYVDISNPIPLGLTSISFWMKSNDTVGDKGITNGLGQLNIRSSGLAMVRLSSNNYKYFADVSSKLDGEWHHWFLLIAGSGQYDIGSSRLFVDGVEVPGGSIVANSGPLSWSVSQIGKGFYGFINAQIDEVAIWSTDETANIATIYNGGTPNDISSLNPTAWYQFNEGSGTTAIDSAGSNNGTISGATYSTDVPS